MLANLVRLDMRRPRVYVVHTYTAEVKRFSNMTTVDIYLLDRSDTTINWCSVYVAKRRLL